MYNYLFIEKKDGVATVVLNRPERYNALNKELCKEIALAVNKLSADPETRVIRVKGMGKGFCAGLDLFSVDAAEFTRAGNIVTDLFNPIVLAVRHCEKPVVAQVTGAAAGAGASLALACDMVYASEDVQFSLPFTKIALLPDTGASYWVVKQLGYKKAFEVFSSSQTLSAAESLSLGLINRVVAAEELEQACMEHCISLTKMHGALLANLKQLLQSAEKETLEETLNLEAYYQDQAASHPAFLHAVQQFKKK